MGPHLLKTCDPNVVWKSLCGAASGRARPLCESLIACTSGLSYFIGNIELTMKSLKWIIIILSFLIITSSSIYLIHCSFNPLVCERTTSDFNRLYSSPKPQEREYQKKGCVGFDELRYVDHIFTLRDEPGIWDLPNDNPLNDKENVFQLRLGNNYKDGIYINHMLVEYPEGVIVDWASRGYDCPSHSSGDTIQQCYFANVTGDGIITIKIEDVGNGTIDLIYGMPYSIKVTVETDEFNGHIVETAICTGKIE